MRFRLRGPKIVLSGYYGFDNCGDEAVLSAIVHCLKKLRPDARITVLSGNPKRTRDLHNVRAVNRWNPIRVIWELLACPLFISGGGSLIQDITSARSANYYLTVIRIATALSRKTMIYGQGIGPLSNPKVRERTMKTLERCDAITLRDGDSAALLREIGVKRGIEVTCDPVLALSYEDIDKEEIEGCLRELNVLDENGKKRKPLLLVTARCWEDNRHLPHIARVLDAQARRGWDVLLAPMHFPEDMQALNEISNLMTERLYCLGTFLDARQFMALTAYADRVFSMRLHGLIFAMAAGAPMIGLSYDPKVKSFMELAGLGANCVSFEDFDWQKGERVIEEMDYEPLTALSDQESRRRELRAIAWKMAESAAALLK